MPIDCPIEFPRLSTDEMRAIDYLVMGHAFANHKLLGCLCDECVYQPSWAKQLQDAGFCIDREVPVTLTFRDYMKPLFLDMVVDQRVIYEAKTVKELTKAHEAQLLNYLFLTNAARGKLVNFRSSSVESRFVNSSVDHSQRRQFCVDESKYLGPAEFRELVTDLVKDWGTGLDVSLYRQAIVHCLGGEDAVICKLAMQVDGHFVGRQRFCLMDESTAFHLTAFNGKLCEHQETQLRRLLAPSPLLTIVWANIGRSRLTFQNIQR
ncbi:GxxExxY protein [Roseimaritima ulvae]|uniref:GxxExxY protein n=1 Tax=Roseimaritima ulvae TaxID=980254 RepID=A0A5B9QYR1_9BACT|nr:GxxExxY protein [Roseimaritima ulvae]QEG43079.1 hypothetical protein UC8_51230 [Roseimaritima ulvae]